MPGRKPVPARRGANLSSVAKASSLVCAAFDNGLRCDSELSCRLTATVVRLDAGNGMGQGGMGRDETGRSGTPVERGGMTNVDFPGLGSGSSCHTESPSDTRRFLHAGAEDELDPSHLAERRLNVSSKNFLENGFDAEVEAPA